MTPTPSPSRSEKQTTMKVFMVPVNLVEYQRTAFISARTKSEAAQKARRGEWIEAGDPERYRITVVGKIEVEP